MPPRILSHRERPAQQFAAAQNVTDALVSQQQSSISAPTPGALLTAQQPAQVIANGVIPSTPAGTPGPTGARYGMCFYDRYGILAVQIDQYGWHLYSNGSGSSAGPAVYSSELVTYT